MQRLGGAIGIDRIEKKKVQSTNRDFLTKIDVNEYSLVSINSKAEARIQGKQEFVDFVRAKREKKNKKIPARSQNYTAL